MDYHTRIQLLSIQTKKHLLSPIPLELASKSPSDNKQTERSIYRQQQNEGYYLENTSEKS